MATDPIDLLTENIVVKQFEDIPVEARERAKKCVIDTIGVMLAGSSAPGCSEVVEIVRGWGGREDSTICTYGGKVPAPNAAWANAVMARARDFDDVDTWTGDHPSVSAVTAALTVSEWLGRVSGKQVITAIVLGTDLVLRLRTAAKQRDEKSPWTTGTFSGFPSAVVTGRLMGFDRSKMLNALGLAYSQLSNTLQGHVEGALSVRVHHGLGVRGGILAALLADKGITAPAKILEGKFGFYPVFFHGQYDPNVLLAGLGQHYLITRLSVKPYPCCALTHTPIDATLEMVRKHDLKPEDIAEIVVHMTLSAYEICFTVEAEKKRPRSIPAAQFSIPYCVATAVVHRGVSLNNFTVEGIQDPQVLSLAGRVKAVVDMPNPKAGEETGHLPCFVEIRTQENKVYSAKVQYVRGHPENPVSLDDCVEKFRQCVRWGAKPLARKSAEEVINLVHNLEMVDDVGRISHLLAATS